MTNINSSLAGFGDRTFGYDDAFRITTANDNASGAPNWTLGYDSLDRLNSATKTSTTIGYTYDANGNRLTQTGTSASTYTMSSSSNRLSSVSGALVRSYTYDNAGNSLTTGATTHTYYNSGRMKTAKLGSAATTQYWYNALGQRIKKTGPLGTTIFMYDEAGHLLGEYTAAGTMVEETVWLGDIPIATLRPATGTATVYYVHTDQLGTPRKVTNNNSTLTLRWSWDPTPFGEGAANESPTGLTSFKYNLRFPGQYFDAESNLNYNYFRDLDPAIGRYVESDPIGLRGGSNSTYDYVRGSPLASGDPLGLLVRGSGWSAQQWRDIQNAENKIRSELRRSCSCHKNSADDSCIPCELVEVLLGRLDTVTVAYAPLAGNCGFTPPGQTAGLFLSEVAWDKRRCPKCLTINLFHELLHTTGLQDDPGPAPAGPVYDLERGCMNNLCRGR